MPYLGKFYYDGMSLRNHRSSNMDSVLLKERTFDRETVYLAVICDGVGSLDDGAFAAAMAVEKLNEWFDAIEDTERIGMKLLDRVREISVSISILAKSKNLQTASTLSALLLTGAYYYIVHTGDSRIYCLKSDQLIQLTTDQVSEGRLTSCLGREGKLHLQYGEGANDARGYLLCSDGLHKKMEEQFLYNTLRDTRSIGIKRTMEKMVNFVVDRGEKDNISLAIMMCER